MIADKEERTMDTHILRKLNKALTLLIIPAFLFALSGCGNTIEKDSRINVVAVSYAQYDFAKKICGEYADISMLSKPGGDVHGYEPSLSDIKKIANADVFLYNGGESDKWVEGILESIDDVSARSVRLADSVELICSEHRPGENHHNHKEHTHFDEHIQSSPKNAVKMIDAICVAVSESDPVHRKIFEFNASEYISEIKKIDKELEKVAETADNKKLIVADRFPFLYLAHHYGFEYEALFAGCSQENDANASVMIKMIEDVKENNIGFVLHTEHSDGKMADTVCEETGALKIMLHSCEGISRSDFEKGVSFAELMKQNVKNLREVLS